MFCHTVGAERQKGRSGWTCQILFMPTTGLMLCWGKHGELQGRWWSWMSVQTTEYISCFVMVWVLRSFFEPRNTSARSRSCSNQRAGCSHPWFGGAFLGFDLQPEKNIVWTDIIFCLRLCRSMPVPGRTAWWVPAPCPYLAFPGTRGAPCSCLTPVSNGISHRVTAFSTGITLALKSSSSPSSSFSLSSLHPLSITERFLTVW